MNDFVPPLLLGLDVASLAMSLINIASPHGEEAALGDAVERALRGVGGLTVSRVGAGVVARTDGGLAERVVLAGRLDTAGSDVEPLARVEMGRLYGPGACSAKGALAVLLKAVAAGGRRREVTVVLLAGSQTVEHVAEQLRDVDLALLAEPTGSAVAGAAVDHPLARSLVELSGVAPLPGPAAGLERWAALGVPAVAFGPGDAGEVDEFVPTAELTQCEFVLRQWLTK